MTIKRRRFLSIIHRWSALLECFLLATFLLGPGAVADVQPGYHNVGDKAPVCVEYDERTLYRFKPNCREMSFRAGRSYMASYNDMGLRDRDYPPRARKSWKRILVLGPSQLVAPGLSEKDGPVRALERLLRGAHPKLEVINGGVEGYTAVQSAIILPSLLKRYSPTHVVYAGGGYGAMLDVVYSFDLVTAEGRPVAIADSARAILAWNSFLKSWAEGGNYFKKHAFLTAVLRGGYSLLQGYKCLLYAYSAQSRAECLFKSSFDAIRQMRDDALASGAKFVVVHRPEPLTSNLVLGPGWDLNTMSKIDALTPDVSFGPDVVTELFRRRGIHALSVKPIPIDREAAFLPNDHHFNEAGSVAYAKQLAELLSPWLSGR